MSFKHEVIDVMTRVQWDTELDAEPISEETLDGEFCLTHFDRKYVDRIVPFFKVACKYNLVEEQCLDFPHQEKYLLMYRIDVSLKLCARDLELQEKLEAEKFESSPGWITGTIKRRRVNSGNEVGVSTEKVNPLILDNTKRPSSVWINFSGSRKKLLVVKSPVTDDEQQPTTILEWSETFFVDRGSSYDSLSVPLTCVFWLKFDSTDHGEMHVIKHMTNLFVEQSNCDVQFCFKGSRIKVGGHASILAARSPVFAAMFQHDMQEKKTGKVVIKDIKPNIFNDLLHYIYSGRTSAPLNQKTAQLMFMAADKYNIDDLKEYCVTFLLSEMETTDALGLLIWAHLNSIEKIKEASIKFIAAHARIIFRTSEWKEACNAHPNLCLLITQRM
ncbi:uncharacterized protein LOC124315380 [Daphnia pulicaria]|uniref:uncharacterized protein LOC124315380 n=1 Tax=Daphnia pulicaria TaxID=35523 RepID=UPI001EEAD92F|nr:uncharacterized protein LOC124315380 [Daphnia pulicaria]